MNAALLFPGQGSQFIGMGKELYKSNVIAKEVFQEVDHVLNKNLSSLIFDGELAELTLTANAQPAIMATSIAILRVLLQKIKANDISAICSFVAGHSLGEYSALCGASTFSLCDTTKLLNIRGNAMQNAVPEGEGAMAALLSTDVETVMKVIDAVSDQGVCEIANDNGAGQVVISGAVEAIDKALAVAAEIGVKRIIKLQVSAPFHCSLIKRAEDEMREALQSFTANKPIVPIVANYTAAITNDPKEIKELLVRQVCNMVRWRETIQQLYSSGVRTFIEVGPGRVLTNIVNRTFEDHKAFSVQDDADIEKLLESI